MYQIDLLTQQTSDDIKWEVTELEETGERPNKAWMVLSFRTRPIDPEVLKDIAKPITEVPW